MPPSSADPPSTPDAPPIAPPISPMSAPPISPPMSLSPAPPGEGPGVLTYQSPQAEARGADRASTLSLVASGLCLGLIALMFALMWKPGLYGFIVLVVAGPLVALLCAGSARKRAAGDPGQRRRARLATMCAWGTMAVSAAAAMIAFSSDMGVSREIPNRVKCRSNLRAIGQSILLYANENKGHYPPALDLLISTQDVGTSVFICPSSNDDKAQGATSELRVQDFRTTPGRCSYIYIGAAFTQGTATAAHVIAYEPLANHSKGGMNVLYGDGHVDWLSAADARYLLTELQAGRNPPKARTAGAAGK